MLFVIIGLNSFNSLGIFTLLSKTKETDLVEIIFKRSFYDPSITILPEFIIVILSHRFSASSK